MTALCVGMSFQPVSSLLCFKAFVLQTIPKMVLKIRLRYIYLRYVAFQILESIFQVGITKRTLISCNLNKLEKILSIHANMVYFGKCKGSFQLMKPEPRFWKQSRSLKFYSKAYFKESREHNSVMQTYQIQHCLDNAHQTFHKTAFRELCKHSWEGEKPWNEQRGVVRSNSLCWLAVLSNCSDHRTKSIYSATISAEELLMVTSDFRNTSLIISHLKVYPRQSEGRKAVNITNWKFMPSVKTKNQKTCYFKNETHVFISLDHRTISYRT